MLMDNYYEDGRSDTYKTPTVCSVLFGTRRELKKSVADTACQGSVLGSPAP